MSTTLVRRIVVALDASPSSQAALEEAAALAERLQAELTGIFVLDADLLRLAGLPLAHETGLTSATRRALDPRSMERSLRHQADVARRALEGIAERRRLQTSFKLLTGNVAASLLEATAQADVLAMGTMGHMLGLSRRLGSTVRSLRASSHCSMLLLAQQPLRAGAPRALVLVYSGSPDSVRALDLTLELARQREATSEETTLVVLLYGDAASRPELRRTVQARLADAGLSAAFDDVEPASLDQLRNRIRAWHGLLVVGQDSGLLDDPEHPPTGLGVPMLCVRCPGDGAPAEGG